MKVLFSKPVTLALLSLAAFTLAGCGKSKSNDSQPPVGQAGVGGVYGPGGYIPGAGGIGGCIPVQPGAPIPIALQGAIFDSANLIAQPGQAVIGGNGAIGGNFILAGQGSDATAQIGIQLQNLMQVGPTPVQGQGVVMITPLRYQVMVQRAMMMGGGGMGMPYPQYPQPYPQQPQLCASGVIINLGHYNTHLYGGTITLIMNGGQYTEELFF